MYREDVNPLAGALSCYGGSDHASLGAWLLTLSAVPCCPRRARARRSTRTVRRSPRRLSGPGVIVNFWATWCRPCLKEIPSSRRSLSGTVGEACACCRFLDEPGALRAWCAVLATCSPDFRAICADIYMDAMVSVIDPAWNETAADDYIATAPEKSHADTGGKSDFGLKQRTTVADGRRSAGGYHPGSLRWRAASGLASGAPDPASGRRRYDAGSCAVRRRRRLCGRTRCLSMMA